MSETKTQSAFLEGFDTWLEASADAEWTHEWRQAARDRFEELGFPTAREEDWRFTPMNAWRDRAFQRSEESRARAWKYESAHEIAGLEGARLVLVDGVFREDLSRLDGLPKGVSVISWKEALRDRGDVVETLVPREGRAAGTALEALHAAWSVDGALVEIDAGVVLEHPLHLQLISTQSSTITHPRVVVRLGANAEASWVEDHVTSGDVDAFLNLVTDVQLGANASLDHIQLARTQDAHAQTTHLRVEQERDSRFTSHSITLGGALVRNDVRVRLWGENAECTLNGLVVAGGDQLIDNHTEIHHEVEHTRSSEHYRNVLDDKARGVFSGKVFVAEGAQHTDAEQNNANLLLSDHAQMNTQPQLEIYADDIKASHGATLGQLDKDGLFYLRSRGIGEEMARAMLVHAFANAVVESIELEPVRRLVRKSVFEHLPHNQLGEDPSEELV